MNSVQKILKIFLATKKTLNAEHEYALALLQGSTIIWVQYVFFLVCGSLINFELLTKLGLNMQSPPQVT